jgi:hypothetical protein
LSPLALVFRDVLFLQNITYISWLITECIFLWTPDYRFSLAFSGSTTQVTTINSKKRGHRFCYFLRFRYRYAVVAAITASMRANSAKPLYAGGFESWKSCCGIAESISCDGDGSAGGVDG